MIQVKVCGITTLDQAMYMEAMGVHMLGFNFVKKSPRYLAPGHAGEIISELSPQTCCVGVFQNHQKFAVETAIEKSEIDCLQFHGQESPEFLAEFSLPKIKVFSIESNFDPSLLNEYADVCDYFLFDSKVGGQEGGTGQAFDWNLIKDLKLEQRWLLAGGLGVENIEQAVQEVAPWGVDLNSKIETKPGYKDLELLAQCMKTIGYDLP